ncbi:MAG: hypothetical protein EOP83_34655 [Verrucomicrobiaceae bacterium]|nr:MAG: hypothetical protein EOP83_34655 [Verrucomicrobiaceae bacterium]
MGVFVKAEDRPLPHTVSITSPLDGHEFRRLVREWFIQPDIAGIGHGHYRPKLEGGTTATMNFDDPNTAFEFKMKFG